MASSSEACNARRAVADRARARGTARHSSVSALGVETALEAMASASKLAVAADLDGWLDWCTGEHRRPCSSEPEDLVRYLRALEADGKKPGNAVTPDRRPRDAHRLLGFDRDALPMARNALRANCRRKGAAQRQAAPLRSAAVLATPVPLPFQPCWPACGSDLQGHRDAALLSLGYDAGLRVSELTSIEVKDLRRHRDGTGLLHLPRWKTHQERLGGWAWLSADTMRRVATWRAEGRSRMACCSSASPLIDADNDPSSRGCALG